MEPWVIFRRSGPSSHSAPATLMGTVWSSSLPPQRNLPEILCRVSISFKVSSSPVIFFTTSVVFQLFQLFQDDLRSDTSFLQRNTRLGDRSRKNCCCRRNDTRFHSFTGRGHRSLHHHAASRRRRRRRRRQRQRRRRRRRRRRAVQRDGAE